MLKVMSARKRKLEASEQAHISEKAHKKGLGIIDLYWFVYILDKKNCHFYFADYEEVSKWDCKLMKYTEAFYCNVQNLKK